MDATQAFDLVPYLTDKRSSAFGALVQSLVDDVTIESCWLSVRRMEEEELNNFLEIAKDL